MKKIIYVFLIAIAMLFFTACSSNNNNNNDNKDEDIFKDIPKTIEIYEDTFFDFNMSFNDLFKDFSVSSDSPLVLISNKLLLAKEAGEAVVTITCGDKSTNITVTIKPKNYFFCKDMSIYLTETKEIDFELDGCKLSDLTLTPSDDNVEITSKDGKYYVTGKNVGTSKITVTNQVFTKEMYVEVKEVVIDVKNETLTVDVLDTLELELDYPKSIINEEDITYTISKEKILKIEGTTVYPLKEGKTRVKIEAGEYKKTIEITVTVDPIRIFTLLNQEQVLMLKSIKLYGSNPEYVEQPFMGSVSRYMFGDLNLVEDIIQLYDNPYKGQVATREIVNYLDKKKNTSVDGAPRSGVKMTSISYITYHDTGNNAAGANARSNANWMVNQYSVTTTARSWHYTVDENQVIHSVPDDEITFQGDTYEAYTTSIGIETCVNSGANMDKVWHRMGKLCAKLMSKYDIDVKHIKQHYDWMGKECPQTLRRNGLYPYAISFVEGELLVKKYLSDYTITFESLSPEYLDNTGQIIKAPDSEIEVSYKLHITNNNGYDEEVTLTSKVSPLK